MNEPGECLSIFLSAEAPHETWYLELEGETCLDEMQWLPSLVSILTGLIFAQNHQGRSKEQVPHLLQAEMGRML